MKKWNDGVLPKLVNSLKTINKENDLLIEDEKTNITLKQREFKTIHYIASATVSGSSLGFYKAGLVKPLTTFIIQASEISSPTTTQATALLTIWGLIAFIPFEFSHDIRQEVTQIADFINVLLKLLVHPQWSQIQDSLAGMNIPNIIAYILWNLSCTENIHAQLKLLGVLDSAWNVITAIPSSATNDHSQDMHFLLGCTIANLAGANEDRQTRRLLTQMEIRFDKLIMQALDACINDTILFGGNWSEALDRVAYCIRCIGHSSVNTQQMVTLGVISKLFEALNKENSTTHAKIFVIKALHTMATHDPLSDLMPDTSDTCNEAVTDTTCTEDSETKGPVHNVSKLIQIEETKTGILREILIKKNNEMKKNAPTTIDSALIEAVFALRIHISYLPKCQIILMECLNRSLLTRSTNHLNTTPDTVNSCSTSLVQIFPVVLIRIISGYICFPYKPHYYISGFFRDV